MKRRGDFESALNWFVFSAGLFMLAVAIVTIVKLMGLEAP